MRQGDLGPNAVRADLYRRLVEASNDGMFVIGLDRTVLMANQRAAAMHGYAHPDEMRHLPGTALVASEDWDHAREQMEQALSSGSVRNVRYRLLRKDGSVMPAEVNAAAIRDERGLPAAFAVVVRDVTEQARTEDALRESENRYRSVVETSLDGIGITDIAGCITFANRRLADLLGYAFPEDLVGLPASMMIAPDDQASSMKLLPIVLQSGHIGPVRMTLQRRNGSVFPAEISGSAITNAVGEPVAITTVVHDLTERLAYEEQLRHQALHDAVTGLPNRTLLHDRLGQAILTSQREHLPFALLLMDLDRFKDINDTFGHHVGDLLLQEVGPRVQEALRASDTVARLGGDEFAVLLANTTEINATMASRKIHQALTRSFVVDGQLLHVEASIGIVLYPRDGQDAPTLLRRADIAMYAAKRANSGHAVYSEEQDENSADRLIIIGDLRQAIDEGAFTLRYQPKIALNSNDYPGVVGVEALIRWHHPHRGYVSPAQFIPLAEHTGLIKPLTLWVLNEVLRQCHVWSDAGREIGVAVNLSARNLHDPELVDMVAELLEAYHVDPRLLTLEITESAIMQDATRAMEVVTYLHDMGVRISIDDFGTGYSSFGYLKSLPADELKIDKTFVREMVESREDAYIVRSVIDLGHNLDLQVVAEGVETQAVLDVLTVRGCDIVQGHYPGRPMSAEALIEWLRAAEARSAGEPLTQTGA